MTNTIKIVIANQDSPANKITKGKQYKVIGNDYKKYYQIIDDEGLPRWVWNERFDSQLLSSAKAIAEDAEKLAERLRVRDEVADAIRCETKPGGLIHRIMQDVRVASGWRILDGHVSIESNNFKINEARDPNVEVLEQLREILRVPEGESILIHAKAIRALADALIGLQNSTNC